MRREDQTRHAHASPVHGRHACHLRIDWLAKSLKDLQDIVHELKGTGVTLHATEQTVEVAL